MKAVEFIRCAERGTSQARLLRSDDGDGRLYWVKFQGNPQGQVTLIRDWIASRLASSIGFRFPVRRSWMCPRSSSMPIQAFDSRTTSTVYNHRLPGFNSPLQR